MDTCKIYQNTAMLHNSHLITGISNFDKNSSKNALCETWIIGNRQQKITDKVLLDEAT